jgi:hypothetical protein
MQIDAQIHQKIRQSRGDKTGTRCIFPKAFNLYYRTFITTYYFVLEILVLKMNQVEAVPDPALTLLDSNFVEPQNLQLLFRPSGQYAASTHLVHIRVPFNFSQVLATPNDIFLEYRKYVDKWHEPHCTQLEEIAELSRFIIADQISDFIDMLDALPPHEIITREKRFLDLIALGMSATSLTLSTINTAKISALEKKIALNNKKLDHLVDITSLHEQHFKAVDQKLDDIANQLAIIMAVNKAHFAKLTNFMEQKFGTAIKIAERLIHTAYKNRLAPGALHHDVLLQIIDYIDEVAA